MLDGSSIAIEWIASGALVTALGALIKFAGWTWLLAGYSESTSTVPDDVVRDIAGSTILRVGIAVLLIGVIGSVVELPSYVAMAVLAVILLAVLRLLYQLNIKQPQAA